MFRRLKVLSLIALPAVLTQAGCQRDTFPTPLELALGDSLTSYEAMLSFLVDLHDRTRSFTMDTIGTSVEGRSLVLLRFTDPDADSPDKLRVLIYAQQHGNEPSGKEAAIALARDIATGQFTDFLRSVDLYLVPQVNPDGSEMRQRRNADEKDLNRDHLTLSTPEVAALHSVFYRYMPEVTLDVHEYGFAGDAWEEAGIYKDFGQQIGALSNPNMSMELRTYAWERVIPDLRDRLAPKDVLLQRYLVTDGPSERFRYSTTALNDGRNSMGIYGSLSFLTEGRNGLTVESDIRERSRQQLETMKAFVSFFSDNAAEVNGLVEEARAGLTGAGAAPNVALVMDYVKDPDRPSVSAGVIDIETGQHDIRVFENFYPLVEATLSVQRPLGYAIPAHLSEVIEVINRHGIEAIPSERPTRAAVESYRIEHVTESEKEDKEFLAVDVTVSRDTVVIPEGDVMVWSDQMRSNLIVALLEPQSQWGLAPLPEFSSLLAPGSDYPILRIVETVN